MHSNPSEDTDRALDRAGLEAALAAKSGRALVVHHFATWCDPCEEELPLLAAEMRALRPLGVQFVAVAWDLFMTPVRPEEALRACRAFLERHGASFDAVFVFTGPPEELFASQGLEHRTVPCTDVRDAKGDVRATFPAPLFDEAERLRFASAVRAAAGVPS